MQKDNPNAFIAERAWADLKTLNDMGPRVSGSYTNEVLAVNFLKREINSIQQAAHKNQKIHADVQIVSGSYWLGFKPQGGIFCDSLYMRRTKFLFNFKV